MKTIRMNLPEQKIGTSYDIFVGSGILDTLGEKISTVFKGARPEKAGIITDAHVAGIHLERTADTLERSGFTVWTHVFEPGDASKNMSTLNDILCGLAKQGFNRSDLLIALGGGVTGDITGFAAAVFMRGLAYVQVPTTFLAAIDSSVGGKTAVNLEAGKNLAGAFWQPSMVLCDVDTLKTLPAGIFREGLAEAVKYGFIKDKSILTTIRDLKAEDSLLAEEIISRCIEIKCAIVEADERDFGERMLLNFGHTIGHAIEKLTDYQVSHGEAVALGMIAEAKAAYRMGYCSQDFSIILRELLRDLGFETDMRRFEKNQLYDTIMIDKKWMGKGLTIIVPEEIGRCRLQKIDSGQLMTYVENIF